MNLTRTITVLALVLFTPLFVIRGIGPFDFWWWMSANLGLLLALTAVLDPDWRTAIRRDLPARPLFKISAGLLSAAFLYLLFYAGDVLSRQLFTFAGSGIDKVYAFKGTASPLRIALLMLAVIGPGEELFWRGFVQRRLQTEHGRFPGFLLATAVYTLMHAGSGNVMLVLAAGLCGLFWGYLYLKTGSLLLNVVSHTTWDLAIFLLLPVSG